MSQQIQRNANRNTEMKKRIRDVVEGMLDPSGSTMNL